MRKNTKRRTGRKARKTAKRVYGGDAVPVNVDTPSKEDFLSSCKNAVYATFDFFVLKNEQIINRSNSDVAKIIFNAVFKTSDVPASLNSDVFKPEDLLIKINKTKNIVKRFIQCENLPDVNDENLPLYNVEIATVEKNFLESKDITSSYRPIDVREKVIFATFLGLKVYFKIDMPANYKENIIYQIKETRENLKNVFINYITILDDMILLCKQFKYIETNNCEPQQ